MSDGDVTEAELPLDNAGAKLARAREEAGLSRAQVAAQTRIPERHLAAIEAGNYTALPAKTYAVGFARSYAKALGIDENEIVSGVRAELAEMNPAPSRGIPAFEPGDPARLPAPRLAWLAALGVLALLVALFFGARSMLAPGGSLPSILPEETPSPAASAAAPAPAAAPTGGPVVFTALEDAIWVKFSDGQGNQLLQKQMAKGESFTLPEGEVKAWTGRPEALAITIGGQPVPKLSDVQKTMKDVPVSAAALLARGTAAAVPDPTASQGAGVPAQTRRAVRPQQPRRNGGQRLPEGGDQAEAVPAAPASAAPAAPAPAPSAT